VPPAPYHQHPAEHAARCTGPLLPVEDHPVHPPGWVGECAVCGEQAQIYRRVEDTRVVDSRGARPGVETDCCRCGRRIVEPERIGADGRPVPRQCYWCERWETTEIALERDPRGFEDGRRTGW